MFTSNSSIHIHSLRLLSTINSKLLTMPAKKKNPRSRQYLRVKNNHTTDIESNRIATELDSKQKSALKRAESAVNGTNHGFKDPSFWK